MQFYYTAHNSFGVWFLSSFPFTLHARHFEEEKKFPEQNSQQVLSSFMESDQKQELGPFNDIFLGREMLNHGKEMGELGNPANS